MATHQLEKTREIALDTLSRHEEERLKPLPKTAPASPPSSSSSPSHEFSFTISLHTSSSSTSNPSHQSKSKSKTTTPPSVAIDLSPADEIFFHGHLLPLQFLSHLPVSPRFSTNSLDSFTLPSRELLEDKRPTGETATTYAENCIRNRNILNNKNNSCSSIDKRIPRQGSNGTRGRTKSKSFSIFGLPRWRKVCENGEKEESNKDIKNKRKVKFNVSHILKRYVRMVRPLLLFRGRREKGQFQRQPYSFSGNLSIFNKHELRGRRGEFSAPASIRTSPTNSGHLVATAASSVPCSASDSTMEELQAAIQAAIAHCKNSNATEEKPKC